MKKLMIVSLDATSMADLQRLKTMPNFKKLCQQGCLVEEVDSIFLTNTYAVHTSLISGVYPAKHQIRDNTRIEPNCTHPRWNLHANLIQHPTLFSEGKRQGLQIANFFWPVCAKLNIRYNVAEYLPQPNENLMLCMLQSATPLFLLRSYALHGKNVKGAAQPQLDDFTISSMLGVVKKAKMDLITIHLTDTDTQKHHFGIHSQPTQDSLERMDKRLGALVDAAAGNYQIVVLSDHAQVDATSFWDVNQEVVELGLSDKLWFHQTSGSAFAYTMGATAQELALVKAKLEAHPKFRRFLSEEEMQQSGFAVDCAFGLCASAGCELVHADHRHTGIHGLPLDVADYRVYYLVVSPKVKTNITLQGGSLLDLTPLFVHLLDISSWPMEKTLRTDLLK
ncbi:MAG: alkaline phosphatase family protein [Erysipelotrichaceae bacterium]